MLLPTFNIYIGRKLFVRCNGWQHILPVLHKLCEHVPLESTCTIKRHFLGRRSRLFYTIKLLLFSPIICLPSKHARALQRERKNHTYTPSSSTFAFGLAIKHPQLPCTAPHNNLAQLWHHRRCWRAGTTWLP
jgi:hypothetical protein